MDVVTLICTEVRALPKDIIALIVLYSARTDHEKLVDWLSSHFELANACDCRYYMNRTSQIRCFQRRCGNWTLFFHDCGTGSFCLRGERGWKQWGPCPLKLDQLVSMLRDEGHFAPPLLREIETILAKC